MSQRRGRVPRDHGQRGSEFRFAYHAVAAAAFSGVKGRIGARSRLAPYRRAERSNAHRDGNAAKILAGRAPHQLLSNLRDDPVSYTSVLLSGIGAFVGIWVGYKMSQVPTFGVNLPGWEGVPKNKAPRRCSWGLVVDHMTT